MSILKRFGDVDTDGMQKKKFYKIFCFVHDDDLRSSYNTYERVERLASKGFQESACDTSK